MADADTEGDAVRFSRADLTLMRRAARQGWGVPDAVQNQALWYLAKALADEVPGKGKDRLKLTAIRLLVQMDRADQLAKRDEEPDKVTAAEAIEGMEAAGVAYDAGRTEGGDSSRAEEVPGPAGPVQLDDPGAG